MSEAIPYRWLYIAAIVFTVIAATIGLIQAADPATLGFGPVAARWLGVISGVVGVVLGFLPRITEGSRRITDAGPPVTSDVDQAAAGK